ncbi:alpha/beta hydrolase family protein [Pollutibacter soli]|uniref:alpha/beta hydrolase family protein n=1 Tax=Pollutibacter soli TaxID=3034157 RepID=UPI003013BB2E
MRPIISIATVYLFLQASGGSAQSQVFYQQLPTGKYAVGFTIITLTDDTRIEKPEYNYLGEKNEGDRRKKVTIHLWYPAQAGTGSKGILYQDYCYNNQISSTKENLDTKEKQERLADKRRTIENWFGKVTDSIWTNLLNQQMLAVADASPLKQQFPLLVGMLRSLSTSLTNEMLASNGYVVAMVRETGQGSLATSGSDNLTDMRFAMTFLLNKGMIDGNRIGTFGFSGSGFAQVLLAMNDYRIKAVADIESGIYMDRLYQSLAASNFYQPANLSVPFLHIFSKDLSKQEIFLSDFENKTKFTTRYRLLLNQPALHHWDFAVEGYASCLFLNNRGDANQNIRRSFEISNLYLLNFFNAVLKDDAKAKTFMETKPTINNTSSALWDIYTFERSKRAPDVTEFEYIIRNKGINEAIAIAEKTLPGDTLSNINVGFTLNNLGYKFLNEKKYDYAIAIFKLNSKMHPEDPNLMDSLAEGYEVSGDKANMKKVSQWVFDMLNTKSSPTDFEKSLKDNAMKRLK